MGLSRHYTDTRVERDNAIKAIGLGTIVYRATVVDTRRNKSYIYEVSTTAILTIRAVDNPTLIITRYPARPSRLRQFWAEVTDDIIEVSVRNTRKGLVF